jgi:hypothetical protein
MVNKNAGPKKLKKKVMDAKFANTIKSAEDAGLPEDFKGSKQDIFDALKYGIYVHDSVYYSRGGRNGGDYPISNFTMKILYHLPTGSDDYSYRLISVKNTWGFEVMINMNTDDFVSLGSFKKVLARRGDFVFKGTDSDLTRLQEFLQKDEVKTVYIETLGWHKSGRFWAWANGITPADGEEVFLPADKNGIVTYNEKNYFIPACSNMYVDRDEEFVNEKKFTYCQPLAGFAFNEWSALMYKVYKKNAIPAILHYIGAIHRDIIFNQFSKFPLLNLFGPPQTGKSEMGNSLMSMFGERQKPISLEGESTGKSYMRKIAQIRNGYSWMEEYKNNQIKHIGNLKNLYDGLGYDRAQKTNDNQTKQTPVNSSVILSGQEMPTAEPALFTRVVFVSFSESKYTLEESERFRKLKEEYEAEGLSYITAAVIKTRSVFEKEFASLYPTVFGQVHKKLDNPEISDRMKLNTGILLTTMQLAQRSFQFPFTYTQAEDFLLQTVEYQHNISAGSDNVARFWQVIEQLFHQDLIKEEKDFVLSDGYLYICINKVHALYVKEMIAQRDANYLQRNTLEFYLKLDKQSFVDYTRKRFDDGSNNWCYKMKYSRLGIDMLKLKPHSTETTEQFNIRANDTYQKMGLHNEPEPKETEGLPF